MIAPCSSQSWRWPFSWSWCCARLHAFVALVLTSLAVAIAGGMSLAEMTGFVRQAMGATLGYIAIVVGLGAMFGEVFRRTGAAERMAATLVDMVGPERAPAGDRGARDLGDRRVRFPRPGALGLCLLRRDVLGLRL